MNNREAFLKRLRATFRTEADEHIRAIAGGLRELNGSPAPDRRAQLVETVFRETHSLKGAARSVDLHAVESVCQPMESLFSALKRGELSLQPALFDILEKALDTVADLVADTGEDDSAALQARVREATASLKSAAGGGETPAPPEPGDARPNTPPPETAHPAGTAQNTAAETVIKATVPAGTIKTGTVRIPMEKLDPLLYQAEEMIAAGTAAYRRAAELRELARMLDGWKAETDKWRERSVAERDWKTLTDRNDSRLNELIYRTDAVRRAVESDARTLGRMVDDHLEDMKGIMMLPVAALVEPFPRMVRELARDQGKRIDLVVDGTDIELDKRILEELKDPLVHLLRNAVDHGIGNPGERSAQGRPAHGTVTLSFAARENRQVEISVSDDGGGIDADRVRAAAEKAGVTVPETDDGADRRELHALIFRSGISTSPIITSISGRGLGLAIVREKAEMLGGTVSVDTRPREGTTFRLRVPMTLATFRGILLKTGGHAFVLPANGVERIVRITDEDLRTVESRDTIRLDGRVLAAVGLDAALGLPPVPAGAAADPDAGAQPMPAVIVSSAGRRLALLADEVLDECQVLVKSLGKQLVHVRNIAGATILGSGKVVPVLNTADLVQSAVAASARARTDTAAAAVPAAEGRLLVAEDSITSRTLLKSILETAGYRVTTAVDGMDAFTRVRSGEFDLVVSDVDMPRMNGFELTAKIRDDRKLADLPVVLVTALESREDRERGIEAGADAYIVKSSFDQSDLVETVKRLV